MGFEEPIRGFAGSAYFAVAIGGYRKSLAETVRNGGLAPEVRAIVSAAGVVLQPVRPTHLARFRIRVSRGIESETRPLDFHWNQRSQSRELAYLGRSLQ